MATRARRSHGRQRQRLIDACISALHIYGPSRTTVEKVVAIAKMSPGIVRFYFESKAAMLVASLAFLAAEFDERVIAPVAKLKASPGIALETLVDLYLDPDIASPRKVSVWYAFWGEASSRQEYYDICGQKDEGFALLVRELIGAFIVETEQSHLDADGVALGLIGALEILWQEIAFQTERDIDRITAKRRCMSYLQSVFPRRFDASLDPPARLAGWAYRDERIFKQERDFLFRRDWLIVGHESELAIPGDFLCIDSGVERVVVVRDAAGVLHALRNSCPAMPHVLVAGCSGRFTGAIECRMHGLKFEWDGRQMAGRDGPDLQRLEARCDAGWILARAWGGLDTGVPHRFGTLRPLFRLGSPIELPVAADWKVVIDLWLEGAAVGVSGKSDDSLSWSAAGLDHSRWSAARYLHLSRCPPDAVWNCQFLAPGQVIETRSDGTSVLQVLPVAPGRCRVRRVDYATTPQSSGAGVVVYLARRIDGFIRGSTLAMAESIQHGRSQFGHEAQQTGHAAVAAGWFRDYLFARVPALARWRSPTAA